MPHPFIVAAAAAVALDATQRGYHKVRLAQLGFSQERFSEVLRKHGIPIETSDRLAMQFLEQFKDYLSDRNEVIACIRSKLLADGLPVATVEKIAGEIQSLEPIEIDPLTIASQSMTESLDGIAGGFRKVS